jgi:hypothetical protein
MFDAVDARCYPKKRRTKSPASRIASRNSHSVQFPALFISVYQLLTCESNACCQFGSALRIVEAILHGAADTVTFLIASLGASAVCAAMSRSLLRAHSEDRLRFAGKSIGGDIRDVKC